MADTMWHWVVIAMAGIIAVLLIQMALIPFIKIEIKRRASRAHIPQPEEVWMQDDDLLYIDAVSPTGVELMAVDGRSKSVSKWKDTWPEWERRLRQRVVYWTGQKRPLGDA